MLKKARKYVVAATPCAHTLTTPEAMIETNPACARPWTKMNIPNANGTSASGRRRSVAAVEGNMRKRRRTMPCLGTAGTVLRR